MYGQKCSYANSYAKLELKLKNIYRVF